MYSGSVILQRWSKSGRELCHRALFSSLSAARQQIADRLCIPRGPTRDFPLLNTRTGNALESGSSIAILDMSLRGSCSPNGKSSLSEGFVDQTKTGGISVGPGHR